MRIPVVAGVAGGVGTTTVAVGLRGHDGGRVAGAPPDILVCRATLDSLRRAAAVLDETGPEPRPVLAVTLTERVPRRPLRARLELLEPDAAALVLLPHVRRWCTLVDPLAEAAQLLVEPAAQLPRPLRAYAGALRELVAAVTASGRLGRGPGEGAGVPHTGRRGPGASRPVFAPREPGPAGPRTGTPTALGEVGPVRPDPASAPYPRRSAALDRDRRRPRQGVRIVVPAEARSAGGREPVAEPDATMRPPGVRGAHVAERVG